MDVIDFAEQVLDYLTAPKHTLNIPTNPDFAPAESEAVANAVTTGYLNGESMNKSDIGLVNMRREAWFRKYNRGMGRLTFGQLDLCYAIGYKASRR